MRNNNLKSYICKNFKTMKKIFLIVVMLISTVTFAQESENTSTKKELVETLKPYVENLMKGIEKGVEFAAEEIPEVIMQFVIYSAVKSWLWAIVGFMFVFFNRRIRRAVVKLSNKDSSEEVAEQVEQEWGKDAVMWYGISKFVLYIIGFAIFLGNIGTAIKATFLPKLFLVEKFLELV